MYEVKNYEHLFDLKGLSEKLLKNHFALYEGYVKHLNKLNDLLVELEKKGQEETQQFDELNRRFGWEFNGMRLHEYYFENLSNDNRKLNEDSALYKAIVDEWGSYSDFEKDFKAMGAIRGIGWVVLYHDAKYNRLFNVWVNEHDVGHLAGCQPILIMDVFEHAYMLDYGTKKLDYVEMFFKCIDWQKIEQRFQDFHSAR